MLPAKTFKKYLVFLNDWKGSFGLSDWTVGADDKTDFEKDDACADADPDVYEKKLRINLYKNFLTVDNPYNVLIHELIHGRIEIMNRRIDASIESVKYEHEEETVNDITRGFITFLEEKKNGQEKTITRSRKDTRRRKERRS